jgi:uncharacterized membrane protein (Fun14 family)
MTVQFAAVLFLIGLVVLWIFKHFGKVLAALVALIILVAIFVGWCAVFSFNALSGHTLVATVKASQVANIPHEMAVELTTYDSAGNPTHTSYELGGDRWELQCQVVELQRWEMALGFKSGYQLERLGSQYDDDNAHTNQPVQLGSWSWFNGLENNVGLLSPVIRSAYSNAVLEPDDGRAYNVYADSAGDLYAERA